MTNPTPRERAIEALKSYMAAYPAFRIKPEGAPGSPVRKEQERLMALEDFAREAIAALQAESAISVPDGFVLVPREPTLSQLKAGQDAWLADTERKSSTLYKAMIEAGRLK